MYYVTNVNYEYYFAKARNFAFSEGILGSRVKSVLLQYSKKYNYCKIYIHMPLFILLVKLLRCIEFNQSQSVSTSGHFESCENTNSVRKSSEMKRSYTKSSINFTSSAVDALVYALSPCN